MNIWFAYQIYRGHIKKKKKKKKKKNIQNTELHCKHNDQGGGGGCTREYGIQGKQILFNFWSVRNVLLQLKTTL